MDGIIKWIADNWKLIITIVACCGGFDAICGYFPDKWLPYIGIIRRLFLAAARKGGAIK